MNPYLLFVLIFLVLGWLIELLIEGLEHRRRQDEPPVAMREYMDADKFRISQAYQDERRRLGLIRHTVMTAVTIGFIVAGGFEQFDSLAHRVGSSGEYVTGIVFVALWVMFLFVVAEPFRLYTTFRIESRYEFNRTTLKTYVLDVIKGAAISAILGLPIFVAIVWFFETTGAGAWIWCWLLVALVQILLMAIVPTLIMPLFNKFTPLAPGELRTAIETYVAAQQFTISDIYTMDGSKRSSKSNAFFVGIGTSRRIVLYDTLIAQQTVPELLAIVAHEMGHCKRRHILKGLALAIVSTGLTFWVMSLFIRNADLFDAFGMTHVSTYASLVFVGFLYTPIAFVIGIAGNCLSRRWEFQADAYAAATTGTASMATALKKLYCENYANLTPHPLKVFLEYAHPPVLDRVAALEDGG